jgi:hypothetical protein
MEKISWPDRVRDGLLHTMKEDRNNLQIIKRRKANWVGHICLLEYVIEER